MSVVEKVIGEKKARARGAALLGNRAASEVAGMERGGNHELIAGISVVRDARDIIPYLCGHYLRIGFDRLDFVDDGSLDGTFEFLKRLSQRDARVSVRRVDRIDFEQSLLMTEMANALIDQGCRIVFPFDKDEFWNVEVRSIRRTVEASQEGVIEGKWVQFVQDLRVKKPHFFSLLRARHRAPFIANSRTEAVEEGKPRLALTEPKVAFKSSQHVFVGFGQHRLKRGPSQILASDVELFHLPFRSAREIEWRKSIMPRLGKIAVQAFPELEPLSAAERAAVGERFVGSWEVNSASPDGCIVGEDGIVVPLIPDTRLRWLLLKAWLYMALRHPLILLR